jgi:two-component system sensor histidine kinase KdpD
MAETLGAKTATLTAGSVAEAVVGFARRHNVTKIVIGRPIRPRWRELLRGQVVDQIIRNSGPIDVYVISSSATAAPPRPTPRSPAKPGPGWRGYATGLVLVGAATLVGEIVARFLSPANLVMIYLLAVVYAAIRAGFRPAILTAALSVLAFDFFFVLPHHTFAVADTEYLLTFAALFIVGAVISKLVSRVQEQMRAVRVREEQTDALYALSRDLAAEMKIVAMLGAAIRHITETMEGEIVFLLPKGQVLEVAAASPGVSLDDNERAVALWVYHNGQAAGRCTDTLSSADMLYVPMQTAGGVVGVLGVKPSDPLVCASPAQRRLLEAFASQTALAIERAHLAGAAGRAKLLEATQRLESALLNSVSHDLRTPLASITGALSSLRDDPGSLRAEARRELLDTAFEEAERLNRFVGNLLDMTRLEAGALKLKREPHDVPDLIGSALGVLGQRLGGRDIEIDVPSGLPHVSLDFVLMAQVMVNLLDNALKYSPAGTPIEVKARVRGEWLELSVADRGPGIPEEDLERIFDKFYRVSRPDGSSGTGLGLVISKGIVTAHGGRVWAENRPGGGTRRPLEQAGHADTRG